jgi:hypothetical protein
VDGNDLCSPTGSFNLSTCEAASAPVFTFNPDRSDDNSASGKSKSQLPAIFGGAAGAVALVGITIAFVCFCLRRAKSFSSRTSETGSSEPSVQGNNLCNRRKKVETVMFVKCLPFHCCCKLESE